MTVDQFTLFAILIVVFALLVWGRWRYDLVAFGALVVALLTGVVPREDAFVGFGHPATVVIALVLVVSRALSNSGVIELIARRTVSASRGLSAHVGVMSGVAAGLSAVMNNVAALALLMPVDLRAAADAKRSPALTLMPISFASILGGMITLIGTPPNIVVAEYRNDALGAPFSMFDFTPVGLVCASVGVAFIALVGWRLIPSERREHDRGRELFDLGDYVAEVRVPPGAEIIGTRVRALDDVAEDSGAAIIGLVRRGARLPGRARLADVRAEDLLVIQAAPQAIEQLVGSLKLEYRRRPPGDEAVSTEDVSLIEVVVPEGARAEKRSAISLGLLPRHDVTLLGVSRRGRSFREQVRKLKLRAGDILLLLGPTDTLPEVTRWLGCIPLAPRGLRVLQRRNAGLAISIFGGAVLLASVELLYLPIALAASVVLLAGLQVVSLREVYDSVEWPVILLIGSMIPIGAALESTEGTALIADGIVRLSEGLAPALVLTVLMVVTMTLSDVMNNTATAVIAAPIAVDIANRLEVSPDPFLMSVAVAASCAFLTPIGHKNNTLILGPGGYRFGDYWRMGLPLEVLVVISAVPAILWFWPL